MKREDFKIDGIPEGYRVYEVDLTPSGRPVAVLGHLSDTSVPGFVLSSEARIQLPMGMIARDVVNNRMFLAGHVRALGEERILMLERYRSIPNASVLDARGNRIASFDAGPDVEEALVREDLILLFYGDEGQTSGHELGGQGMVVLGSDGSYLWGHASQFGEEALTIWFHSAVWVGLDEVAIFADVKHVCAFVHLNIRKPRQTVWYPPDPISRPDAVTTARDRVLAYGTVVPWAFRGNEETTPDQIIEWIPGDETWRVIDSWPFQVTTPGPPLRGLPGGRFIAVQPDGYTILSFE